MEAPKSGLSLRAFNAAIAAHYREKYEDGRKGLQCLSCGVKIQFTTGNVTFHETPPGGRCTEENSGVKEFSLPYCPKCEGMPVSVTTCIHIGIGLPTRLFGDCMEVTQQAGLSH